MRGGARILPAMRALVVGAGAVGRVFGYHLHRGGAEVGFLVKEKHAGECRGGFTLRRLRRRGALEPTRFDAFEVVTSPGAAAGGRWEQVYLAVSSTGLRAEGFLGSLAEALPEATIVSLQPGLGDAAVLARFVSPDRTVTGLTAFVSFPAAGEMAYWLPPLTASAFSGPDPRLRAVVASVAGGGLPARATPDATRLAVTPSALLTGHIGALEAAGWTFAGVRHGRWLELACRASREAMAIGAAELGARPFALRALVRPVLSRLALRLAPFVVPFDLEAYARTHFGKLRDQTRLAFRTYLEAGRRLGLPAGALEALESALAGADR